MISPSRGSDITCLVISRAELMFILPNSKFAHVRHILTEPSSRELRHVNWEFVKNIRAVCQGSS